MSSQGSQGSGAVTANYSNLKEYSLPEMRITSTFLDDALQSILHTILFVRAPSDARIKDRMCESLAPIIFATCGVVDVENKVNAVVELLKQSLVISSSGQHLKGEITLSFYIRKENRGWIYSQVEHMHLERWRLPVTVLDFTRSTSKDNTNNNSSSSQRRHSTGGIGGGMGVAEDGGNERPSIDPHQAYRAAYDYVTKAIMYIIETVNTSSNQLQTPGNVACDFELNVSDIVDLRHHIQQQQRQFGGASTYNASGGSNKHGGGSSSRSHSRDSSGVPPLGGIGAAIYGHSTPPPAPRR